MRSPVHIRIQNFQSISDLDIEVNGFTCITGKTNIGKSAIIRAISGAFLNTPVVGAVRSGEKFCSVALDSENWGFTWEKGEPKTGVNNYEIRKPEKKKLEKVGQGQLEYIADMGFDSVQIGNKVIQPWFASQFEPVFLLNSSGPAVTDFISDVSRLKVLQDSIIINVRGRKRALEKAKIQSDEIEQLKEKEQKVANLDTLLTLNSELEAQHKSIQEYEERIAIGETLNQDLQRAAQGVRALQLIRDVRIPDTDIDEELESYELMYEQWVELELAAKNIIALHDITGVDLPKLPEEIPQIVQATTLADRIEKMEKIVLALSTKITLPGREEYPPGLSKAEGVLTRIKEIKAEERALRGQLRALKTELGEVESELAEIPVCTTCQRPFSSNHVHTPA